MIAPLAKAMTKTPHPFGAPITFILPCYLIPIFLLLIFYKLLNFIFWEPIPVGIFMHVWITVKFRKDEHWFSNYMDALKTNQYLEP